MIYEYETDKLLRYNMKFNNVINGYDITYFTLCVFYSVSLTNFIVIDINIYSYIDFYI